jgi:hypothetical protein
LPATTDPIYELSLKSDSEGGREVFMVGQGEQPVAKTTEEIAREAEEEIVRVAQLAKEADKGNRNNDLQDDSGSSDDEPRDGPPSRRHHRSTTHDALLDGTNSEIGHGRSTRKSIGLNTKESRSTARRLIMP